jgi:hypothetical protein
MPEQINWSFNIQIVGGPKSSSSQTLDVEAYDKLQVTIEAGASDKEVDIQPGGSGQVMFLQITASAYHESDLRYKINSNSNPEHNLDGALLFPGKGAVALLDPAPTKLFFSNDLAEDVVVEILIGRDATP